MTCFIGVASMEAGSSRVEMTGNSGRPADGSADAINDIGMDGGGAGIAWIIGVCDLLIFLHRSKDSKPATHCQEIFGAYQMWCGLPFFLPCNLRGFFVEFTYCFFEIFIIRIVIWGRMFQSGDWLFRARELPRLPCMIQISPDCGYQFSCPPTTFIKLLMIQDKLTICSAIIH